MTDETKDELDQILKGSRKTDGFLNDDHMTTDIDPDEPSTRKMVLGMIQEGLQGTGYTLVLQKLKE